MGASGFVTKDKRFSASVLNFLVPRKDIFQGSLIWLTRAVDGGVRQNALWQNQFYPRALLPQLSFTVDSCAGGNAKASLFVVARIMSRSRRGSSLSSGSSLCSATWVGRAWFAERKSGPPLNSVNVTDNRKRMVYNSL